MDNIFDGKFYIGLDEDIFGDGESDETTMPLSTYKENVIDGNTRYLTRLRHRYGAVLPQKIQGGGRNTLRKPMGSMYWGVRFVSFVEIGPGTEYINIYMSGTVDRRRNVNSPSGTRDGSVVAARGVIMIGTRVVVTSDVVAWAYSQNADTYMVRVDIPDGVIQEEGVVKVLLETRSATITEAYDWFNPPLLSDRVEYIDGAELEDLYTPIAVSVYDESRVMDILGTFKTVDGKGEIRSVLRRNETVDNLPIGGLLPVTKFYYISYIIPNGFFVEVFDSTDKSSGGYLPKTSHQKAPNQVVKGSESYRHAKNLDNVFTRERALGVMTPIDSNTRRKIQVNEDSLFGRDTVSPEMMVINPSGPSKVATWGGVLPYQSGEIIIRGMLAPFVTETSFFPSFSPSEPLNDEQIQLFRSRLRLSVNLSQYTNQVFPEHIYSSQELDLEFGDTYVCYRGTYDPWRNLPSRLFFTSRDVKINYSSPDMPNPPVLSKIWASIQDGSLYRDSPVSDLVYFREFSVTIPLQGEMIPNIDNPVIIDLFLDGVKVSDILSLSDDTLWEPRPAIPLSVDELIEQMKIIFSGTTVSIRG